MNLRRRSFMACATTGSLLAIAGCSSGNADRPIQVENEEIRTEDRNCVDVNSHASTIAVNEESTTIEANGTIATSRPCLRLRTGAAVTVTDDPEELSINVIADDDEEEDCDPCSAEIDYRLTYEVDRLPTFVTVYHRPGGTNSPPDFAESAEVSNKS